MLKKILFWPLLTVVSLTSAQSKKLYGMTFRGGIIDRGTLFEYDYNTNTNVKKIDFTGSNGTNPAGSLLQASNGKLYGMTEYGGSFNNGVLFEYDLATGVLTKKYEFPATASGRVPTGALIQLSSGKMYGVTSYGGTENKGTLFEYDPATNIYTKKADFNGTNGYRPKGSLMQASNGKLYGTASFGGNTDNGVLFEFDANTGILTKKVNFINITYGSQPVGALLQGTDGDLYGVTNDSGTEGWGTIYKYNITTNTVTKLYDFEYAYGTRSNGTLMQTPDGNLYGMTMYGGAHNQGVLYQFNPLTHLFTKKIDFYEIVSGSIPFGSLMMASNNKIYGMTYWGGNTSDGTLFEYDPGSNVLTKKYDFNNINNGRNPYQSYLIEVTVNNSLSVHDQESVNPADLYPNPVKEVLTISHIDKKLHNSPIQIIDGTGKILLQQVIRHEQEKINVSGLIPGMYYLKTEGNVNRKFIKE